ncbi:MAG: MBL fold metallo-hydrolase, partial [Candidatus Micrarchaeota archaeon]
MKLQFLGATREVGRSCLAMESEGLNLFLDCGVAANKDVPLAPQQDVKTPNAIALSHAHLDHSGFLPAIYKHSNPPVICTFPTIPLVDMLLEDMQKLLSEKGLPQFFSSSDFNRLNRSFLGLPYETDYEFFNGDKLRLYDAGHIIGSSQILMQTKSGNLLYSGDINSVKTEMHRPAVVPKEKIDYLVLESTYGGREHPDRKKLAGEFCDKIESAIDEGASVIVPSFAVGRTQEILQLLLERDLIKFTVLDGMGIRATETYLEYPAYLRDSQKLQDAFEEADKAYETLDRKKFSKPRKIFLCTAGMMEGGPVLSYIQRLMKNDVKTKIFLTGYQGAGTNGRLLLEKYMLRINGKTVQFRGEVRKYDFSA